MMNLEIQLHAIHEQKLSKSVIHNQKITQNTINIQLVQSQQLPIISNTQSSECKYCKLKQKISSPGSDSVCLTHFLLNNKKQQKIISTQIPILSQKSVTQISTNEEIKESTNLTFDKTKISDIANQLLFILSKENKNIIWKDHPSLLNTLHQCFSYLPRNFQEAIEQEQKNINQYRQNQSSIQFQLSLCEQQTRKIYSDDSLKNTLNNILQECKQFTYIPSQTVSSFINQIQSRLQYYQNEISHYRQKIQNLIKIFNEKVSTDHTIKDFSDDMNFLDRLSELQDISIKYFNNCCFMCKHKTQLSHINQDMMHILLSQAGALQNFTKNS